MKIGYPCQNLALTRTKLAVFRLASYSEERLRTTVDNNLTHLEESLRENLKLGLLFFRISSQLVPFASHPVCRFDWKKAFSKRLRDIGAFVRENGIRISMHPDQFTLINSPGEDIFLRSAAELDYHDEFLSAMELGPEAKIQIHVGGLYGDRDAALRRFAQRHERLSRGVRERLVVENDERMFPLTDCLHLHRETGIPVLWDTLHHEALNNGESVAEALDLQAKTWKAKDGIPMIDYSSQAAGERMGKHAATIDVAHFRRFLSEAGDRDVDVMLEIKDKEVSALKALAAAEEPVPRVPRKKNA